MNSNSASRLAFLVALISTLGSLYFSEVLKFPPCVLCWYQRICMYPLVLLFGTALWFEDNGVWRFAKVLSVVGLGIAIYHNLLYYHIIPETISPCTRGISCTTRFVEYLGFLSIPLLALIAFVLTTVICFMPKKEVAKR